MAKIKHLVRTLMCLLAVGQIQQACSTSCVSRYLPKNPGTCIEPSQCTGAALPGICTSSPGTVCCIPSQNRGDPVIAENIYISKNIFYKIFGKTKRSMSLYPYYIKALDDAGISTREQIAAFTAQILYETSNLTLTEEDNDGLQYEGSTLLGNNQPGDGPRFRGRGIIPIRGRHMYKVVGDGISHDLEDSPESAAIPLIAFEIASWLWENGYQFPPNTSSSNTGPLKTLASESRYGFVMTSYAVTQSNRTVALRQIPIWFNIIKILNASCPSDGKGPECTAGERKGVCKLASACKGRSVENLCDGPADIECCVACNKPVDIVFMVDSSGSIGSYNLTLMMNFISDVSCRFYISSSKEGTQIALIRYSSISEIIFDFKKHRSHAAVKQALSKNRYTSGGTQTILALNMALNRLFKNPASGVRAKSSGVSRIIILLTDGKTNNDLEIVRKPANALRREGVDIFAVGIGDEVQFSELKVIANEPFKDYVFLSESFQALQKIVPEMELASCNEPAFLEPGTPPVSIEVKEKVKKFFRFENNNQLEELALLIVNQTTGMMDLRLSFNDKNPIFDLFTSCESKEFNIITESSELEPFINETFCFTNPHGGIFFKNKQAGLKIAFVKMCSRKKLFVGVQGLSRINVFEISLMNFSSSNISAEYFFSRDMQSSNNVSAPAFPLHFRVYIGCALAGSGALVTIAVYLKLLLGAESTEMTTEGSSKTTNMKNEKEEKDFDNSESEEERIPKAVVISNAHAKSAEMITNGSSKTMNMKNEKKKERESAKSAEMITNGSSKTTNMKNEKKKEKEADDSHSEKEKTQKAVVISNAHIKFQGFVRQVLLILSVINAMKRRPKSSYYGKKGKSSESCTKTDSQAQAFNEKCKELAGNNERTTPDHKGTHSTEEDNKGMFHKDIHSTLSSFAETKPRLDNAKVSFLHGSSLKGATSFMNENITSKAQYFLSGKSENPSSRASNGTTVNQQVDNVERMLESVMQHSSKRQRAAMILPCFSLLVSNDDDTEQGETEAREKRFKNDMHVSQAFCVLAVQGIFMLLTKARENEIRCAVAAICVNYLYLVAMVWLLIEAYCLLSMTKMKGKVKSKRKRGIFYIFAWGFPLVVVPLMMIKYKRYMIKPHCWISLDNMLDLAASVPFFVIGLTQMVLFGLLFITLCTYKNPTNNKKKESRKDKLKKGLSAAVCISLVVLGSWVMATLSLNIYNNLYQTAFAAVNSLQGAALVFFYVLRNKETRQAALKLLDKMGCSKKSVQLNDLKLGQQATGSNKSNLERITSLRNQLSSKAPAQVKSFRNPSNKARQQNTTLNSEDPEEIISLKVEEDSNAPRRSNRNKIMNSDEDDDLVSDGGKASSSIKTEQRSLKIKEGARRVHNTLFSLTSTGMLKGQTRNSGLANKLSKAKDFLKGEGQAGEMLSKTFRQGSQKLTKLLEEF